MEIYKKGTRFTVTEKKCTPKEFLLMHPRGVYTLGILYNVKDFKDHALRLTEAVLNFYNLKINDDVLWELIQYASSIINFKFRFTILIFLKSSLEYILFADEPQVKNGIWKSLWVSGAPRESPHIKETGWIIKRQSIIYKMSDGFQEAILHHNQHFYEGLTSNICFVFENGLKTPSRSLVLPGLYLKKVESLCKSLDIPFEESMVSFKDSKDFIGVFITNMGQGVQWVKCIQLEGKSDLLWTYTPNHKVAELQRLFSVLDNNLVT